MVRDWIGLYQQSQKYGMKKLSTHIMRKIYSQLIMSDKIGYLDQIHSLTGRRIDASVLGSVILRHEGSYSTIKSYSNIFISFGLEHKLLYQPDKKTMLQLLTEMKSMKDEMKIMRSEMAIIKRRNDWLNRESQFHLMIELFNSYVVERHQKNGRVMRKLMLTLTLCFQNWRNVTYLLRTKTLSLLKSVKVVY